MLRYLLTLLFIGLFLLFSLPYLGLEWILGKFNREASDADVEGWVAAMTVHGQSRRDVLRGFINAEEFRVLCENYGIIRGTLNN